MKKTKYVRKHGKILNGCYRVTTKKPKGEFARKSFRLVVHSASSAVLIGKPKNSTKTAVHESIKRVRSEKCK